MQIVSQNPLYRMWKIGRHQCEDTNSGCEILCKSWWTAGDLFS